MDRLFGALPFAVGVELEDAVGGNAVGVRQDTAPRHVRLPDKQVQVHVLGRNARQGRGDGHRETKCDDSHVRHHSKMIIIPGIVVTLNVPAPLMHTIGDPSLTGPARKPSLPVLVTNFCVALS